MKRIFTLFGLFFVSSLCLTAQEGFLSPGDNLVVEGVPKIPRALTDEADRYTNTRSAFTSGWHPVRREMLIGTRLGDVSQIHIVKIPGRCPNPINVL